VADIDAPDTTDVDAETLMNLIRRRVYGLPNAEYILSEIERVRLKADGIVTCRIGDVGPAASDAAAPPQPARMGWKNQVKARLAVLIMRAVRINFRYQQVFNSSVVGVLQLLAEDLQTYERRLNAADRLGKNGPGGGVMFDQAGYEERYLDPQPFCRRSLAIFRQLLSAEDVALVLFCGRGELLATFAANNIESVGVDPDAVMVNICRERGFRASHADILKHLSDSPDASYGGIFAWRVVERLTNEQTIDLLELAKRKLRRGGIFVASAVNMDHLPALRKFYADSSLVRPVPVRLLAFMVEQSGFRIHEFKFSGAGEPGAEELSETSLVRDVYPYDEYTVVAVND
jgi:SAM-dependent methyltransferase